MVKRIIEDRLFAINDKPKNLAQFLNVAYPSRFTSTDQAFIQRTVNIGSHFATAFVAQRPSDFMIWADGWGQTLDFLMARFEIKDPLD